MEKVFEITLQNRKSLYNIIKSTGFVDLIAIPEGFRNHIFWNIAHSITIQQQLVYALSGEEMCIPEGFVKKYGNGSVPDGNTTEKEIEEVKRLLFLPLEKTEKDYGENVFKKFNSFTTSANVTLNTVEDAIFFNAYHEGVHLGYILALRKALGLSQGVG